MDREVTKKAMEWIRQLKNSDFFLAEEFFDKHRGNGHVPDNRFVPNDFPSAAFSDSANLRRHTDGAALPWTGAQQSVLKTETTVDLREAYISFIDSLVGDLVKALKDNDVYDDTIIVFTSDHGFHLGEHNIWGKKPNYEVSNQVL